jgi:hypothetical protein
MNRRELVLAILAAANGRPYSPAQLQKTAFLITANIPWVISEGASFGFRPYDYGPFDSAVYSEAQILRDSGDADISPAPWGRWVIYAATPQGVARGNELLNSIQSDAADYIRNVSNWALSQSFTSLVKSIYESYPEMRANSIFRD